MMFGNDGIDEVIAAVTYVDVDTPNIKVFSPSMGSFYILPNLLPGGVWTLPAVGEQWLVRRIDTSWYLVSRVAFQDPKMNLRDEEGTTGIGSSGPTYMIGSKIYVGNDHLDLIDTIEQLQRRISDLEQDQS